MSQVPPLPPPPPEGRTPQSLPPTNQPPLVPHAQPADWVTITPNIQITTTHLAAFGTVVPLAGSEWNVTTSGSTTRTIPAWAIVMCVLFIWVCLLGLLFLAAKEERFSGQVTVAVRTADGRGWSEVVPVADVWTRNQVLSQVAWAQSMTTQATIR